MCLTIQLEAVPVAAILIVVVASYLLILIILLAIRSYTGGLHLDSGGGLLHADPYHPTGHRSYTVGLHLDSGGGLLPAGPYIPPGHQVIYRWVTSLFW